MSVLTEEVLKDLYLNQLLTEKEIGDKYGVSQVCVNRYRKKWGIPTLGKTGRLTATLPQELTKTQEQVLVGSLLGDGWMTASSDRAAQFLEGHCLKQEPYLRWKGDILDPFVSSYGSTKKEMHDEVFSGVYFGTKSCEVLRPYYDWFYPAPERKRVFPADLYKRMTPLVLAVWYMDDGSVTTRGEPKISFGLDDVSRERAIRALKKLGLKPVIYGVGGDQGIHFPKQSDLFRKLIEPYVPDCMAYKLPGDRLPGQATRRNARTLTPEKAKQLYEGGMSKSEIGHAFSVGTSTVARRLVQAGATIRKSGPRKALGDDHAVKATLAGYTPERWATIPEGDRDKRITEILQLIRSLPFPYQAFPSQGEALEVFQQVVSAEMYLNGDSIEPNRRVGLALCQPFFPNRYKACSNGVKSAYESWHRDKDLERAIRFQLKVGDPVAPHRVLRAITMQCRTPVIFRPTVARFLYQRYCPPGGRVWDPCSGYGGRLLGALAAGVHYIGTDVDAGTIEGNKALAKFLGKNAELILTPAQDFQPPQVDMVFTSPPYFSKEQYSKEPGQSWMLGGFQDWVEGFLEPVSRRAHVSLPVWAFFVLNVADVKVQGESIPLVKTTIDTVTNCGFDLKETLQMPLATLNRVNPHEPILVFQKGG